LLDLFVKSLLKLFNGNYPVFLLDIQQGVPLLAYSHFWKTGSRRFIQDVGLGARLIEKGYLPVIIDLRIPNLNIAMLIHYCQPIIIGFNGSRLRLKAPARQAGFRVQWLKAQIFR